MIRYILVFLMVMLFFGTVQAQEIISRRTQADRLFDRAEYYKALDVYLKLTESDNVSPAVIERVADCYRLMNNYDQAEVWYARLANSKSISGVDIYNYAEILLRNKKFDKAREQFKHYFANGQKDQLDFKLAECDSAASWMKQESHYKVANERKMNTIYSDWGVSYLTPSGVSFTSDRSTGDNTNKSAKSIYNRTGNEWLKMYVYDLKSGDTDEMKFDASDAFDLSTDYHTGPMAVNIAGDTAYITVTTRLNTSRLPDVRTKYDDKLYIRRLELLMATRKNGKWSNFKRFPYDNVNAYSVGHAALSKNGQTLYFTSDMPGGYGKTDIWYCQKTSDGKWGRPVNCGRTINTTAEEAFPSVGGDGRLYYASKGLPGMGGYDIFAAKGSGSTWNQPVNLKYPVNSTSDDFSFMTTDGRTGFLSSDRQGGQGSDDIYSFVFNGRLDQNGPNAKKDSSSNPFASTPPPGTTASPFGDAANGPAAPPGILITLQGMVFDNGNNVTLDSATVLLRNTRNEIIAGDLALKDKNFTFQVTTGQDYIIEARKKGYYPSVQRISAKNVPLATITTNMKLVIEELEIGRSFVSRNIYYDLNRATIRPDAMVELDRLVDLMHENPSLKIEISSHTDSRGSDYYNMLLSQARATSAVNYLKRHGISADRMVAHGYGETRLLNKCANGVPCSEEEHQYNRRTEIKVIGGDFKQYAPAPAKKVNNSDF